MVFRTRAQPTLGSAVDNPSSSQHDRFRPVGMKSRLSPVLVGLSLAGCGPGACSSPGHHERQKAPHVEFRVLESHEIPRPTIEMPAAEAGIPISQAVADDLDALLAVVGQYYPRWVPENETVDEYVVRYEESPEQARLRGVASVAWQLPHWSAFLRDVHESLPEEKGYLVQSAVPPSMFIPSYQIVVGHRYSLEPSRYKYMVYRMSHLAPVFDYYESTTGSRDRQLAWSLIPAPEVCDVDALITSKIKRHFPGYRRLDPELGKTPLPDHGVGGNLPARAEERFPFGRAMLAHALFDENRNWASEEREKETPR